MAIQVALFNHKGGVSKTTTSFNLGWMLAEQGHRVVMVDADPQCNLSGLVMGIIYQSADGGGYFGGPYFMRATPSTVRQTR